MARKGEKRVGGENEEGRTTTLFAAATQPPSVPLLSRNKPEKQASLPSKILMQSSNARASSALPAELSSIPHQCHADLSSHI